MAHLKSQRTVYVKPVTRNIIEQNWGFMARSYDYGKIYYVLCNKTGFINWPKTLIYKKEELEKRKHVILLN